MFESTGRAGAAADAPEAGGPDAGDPEANALEAGGPFLPSDPRERVRWLASALREVGMELGAVGSGPEAALDRMRVDLLGLLEQVKSVAAGAQARNSVAFATSQVAAQVEAGVAARRRGRGVAEQVALARRESPSRGSRHLGMATALVREMPSTLAALDEGRVTEWGATVLVHESATLSAQDRARLDAELGPQLSDWSETQTGHRARAVAYRLDPAGFLERFARAERERRVSCRPAPDGMAWLTALLPMAQGIACQLSLAKAADTARVKGDERGRGQLMADLLVERVTGLPSSRSVDAEGRARSGPPPVPVEVQLVVTADTLWGDPGDPAAQAPAEVAGYGPIPAWLARHLVGRAPDDLPERVLEGDGGPPGTGPRDDVATRAASWLRRLWAAPDTGALVAMESRRRVFSGSLRRFLVARDVVCRTPCCDAPIRHVDHVVPHAAGGSTTAANGQGLCQTCNQVKELPGWSAHPSPSCGAEPADAGPAAAAAATAGHGPRTAPTGRHRVVVTTPTGHTYTSTAPPLLPGHLTTAPLPGERLTTPPLSPVRRVVTPPRRPSPVARPARRTAGHAPRQRGRVTGSGGSAWERELGRLMRC